MNFVRLLNELGFVKGVSLLEQAAGLLGGSGVVNLAPGPVIHGTYALCKFHYQHVFILAMDPHYNAI